MTVLVLAPAWNSFAQEDPEGLLLPTPAQPSAGCSEIDPQRLSRVEVGSAEVGSVEVGGVEVGGVDRTFIARAPEDQPPGVPLDLVVAFHGRTNSNEQVRRYFDLDEALPQALIVYPRAVAVSGGFSWSDPGDMPGSLRDYSLFEALVKSFGQEYCLDLSRVFVVGHSLGASFANDVACHRGDLVRAVASVAGSVQGGPCQEGTAALLIHHPEDELVPIQTGAAVRDSFLRANGLGDVRPYPASPPELAALGCVRFGRDTANPVIWCEHDEAVTRGGRYYPHTWPEATGTAIARFFRDLR